MLDHMNSESTIAPGHRDSVDKNATKGKGQSDSNKKEERHFNYSYMDP